ncbi:unnamed protein product [Ectocarpus sp. 12 AP-2014]
MLGVPRPPIRSFRGPVLRSTLLLVAVRARGAASPAPPAPPSSRPRPLVAAAAGSSSTTAAAGASFFGPTATPPPAAAAVRSECDGFFAAPAPDTSSTMLRAAAADIPSPPPVATADDGPEPRGSFDLPQRAEDVATLPPAAAAAVADCCRGFVDCLKTSGTVIFPDGFLACVSLATAVAADGCTVD